MSAYSVSFDFKGNLVIKAKYVNNLGRKVVSLKNIKITVKDGNKKFVGTYSAKQKSLTVDSGSTKDLSFTISKSKLKKKTVDLRNCEITGSYTSVYSLRY